MNKRLKWGSERGHSFPTDTQQGGQKHLWNLGLPSGPSQTPKLSSHVGSFMLWLKEIQMWTQPLPGVYLAPDKLLHVPLPRFQRFWKTAMTSLGVVMRIKWEKVEWVTQGSNWHPLSLPVPLKLRLYALPWPGLASFPEPLSPSPAQPSPQPLWPSAVSASPKQYRVALHSRVGCSPCPAQHICIPITAQAGPEVRTQALTGPF